MVMGACQAHNAILRSDVANATRRVAEQEQSVAELSTNCSSTIEQLKKQIDELRKQATPVSSCFMLVACPCSSP